MTMGVHRLSRRTSTLATLAYADIFGCPLTQEERVRWAIQQTGAVRAKEIEEKNGFFFLRGRRHLVNLRISRQNDQQVKWRIAKRAARWLSFIPSLQLVGVTGGLAMNNAKKTDDIDLFLITVNGTLWISRMLAVFCMDAMGVRRKPQDRMVVNKICLNMFVSESGMAMPEGERDCFVAHEILQMQPLWDRSGTYKKFLRANAWAQRYLPNAWKRMNYESRIMNHGENKKHNFLFALIHHSLFMILRFFEPLAKVTQLWYMKRHRTREVITETMLRFHPKDARRWVIRQLAERLTCFNIPLDKIFYAS